jgi:hypothetical protein
MMNSFWKRFVANRRRKAEMARYSHLIYDDQKMTDELERRISKAMFNQLRLF